MKKQLLFTVLLIAILLLATSSAAAKSPKRTPFTGIYYTCETIDPGEVWYTGGTPEEPRVLHQRGNTSVGRATSDEPLYNADNTSVGNLNLNLVTGSGGLHGTFEKNVDVVDGGWKGHWAGHFTDFLATIKIIGRGTGDLAGMKYFATFEQLTYIPDPDPCEGAETAYAVTGVILNAHGD